MTLNMTFECYGCHRYLTTGDGDIDLDEFEYVLWDGFQIPPQNCREAFAKISQVCFIYVCALKPQTFNNFYSIHENLIIVVQDDMFSTGA